MAATKKQSADPVVSMTRREAIRASRVPGETPDPTPIALPIDHQQPPSLREEMMRFVRSEIAKQTKEIVESFEEADDLDVDDDEPDLTSPYTVAELIPEQPAHYEPDPPKTPETASDAPTGADNDPSDAGGGSSSPENPLLEAEALAPPHGGGGGG